MCQNEIFETLTRNNKIVQRENQSIREKTEAQNIVKEIKAYQKNGYNTYRGWSQIEYQNEHYNIDQKDEGTQDDGRRDGGTNFPFRIKEQETRLTLHEHDDDDDEYVSKLLSYSVNKAPKLPCDSVVGLLR